LVQYLADRGEPAYGLDVIGLGALNVDVVVTSAAHELPPVEDRETPTTIQAIEARLHDPDLSTESFLGGSAFNTMVMLAQLETGLRLGMVGISAPPAFGVQESHADRLQSLRIVDLTGSSPRQPGICLALPNPGGRHLYTAPEANVEIADHLARREELRKLVASARILHVTPFLVAPEDPVSDAVSRAVARFVETAKEDRPDLVLSFDPGHIWVDNLDRLPAVHRIFGLADVVYVNAQEHAALGGRSLRRLCAATALVIVKSLRQVVVQHTSGLVVGRVPRRHDLIAVDPTGAGDAVAAGVLAAVGGQRSLVDGCRLGLRIAALRVSAYGDLGHRNLRRDLDSLWDGDRVRKRR
jgi:sugar/nucleoside kinase (ribokinase family)